MHRLRIGLAQINTTVGDLHGNTRRIVGGLEQARAQGVDLVLFPELAVPGYPPEDLLLKPSFIEANRASLNELLPHTQGLIAVVGFVDADSDIYNAAAVLHDGQLVGTYHKTLLPNYAVFDEVRYFKAGRGFSLYELDGIAFGVSVCEDIWYPAGPPEEQAASGAELLLNISASPYHMGKLQDRERMLCTRGDRWWPAAEPSRKTLWWPIWTCGVSSASGYMTRAGARGSWPISTSLGASSACTCLPWLPPRPDNR
jgi:NAD+ synthase (glutamine-hydrolysing)